MFHIVVYTYRYHNSDRVPSSYLVFFHLHRGPGTERTCLEIGRAQGGRGAWGGEGGEEGGGDWDGLADLHKDITHTQRLLLGKLGR